ncbi:MAG TPA: hypothetical protein VJB60_04080 [Candidatus Peribacterales bacterium]|nr:hypothetical protein [Candidatus Peribacterales bacterium]
MAKPALRALVTVVRALRGAVMESVNRVRNAIPVEEIAELVLKKILQAEGAAMACAAKTKPA